MRTLSVVTGLLTFVGALVIDHYVLIVISAVLALWSAYFFIFEN